MSHPPLRDRAPACPGPLACLLLALAALWPAACLAAPDGPATQPTSRPVRVHLLMLEGTPRWEYRHLLRQMMRDPDVVVSSYLYSADPGAEQEGDNPIQRPPATQDDLAPYDVVLVGDVDPQQLTQGLMEALAEYAKGGGGLILLAGQRHNPVGYAKTPLADLMPVDVSAVPDQRNAQAATGFCPSITREGRAGLFRISDDLAENNRLLQEQVREIFWYCPGLKAGRDTTVLARRPDGKNDDDGTPLLVAGSCGKGKTLFCAMDETWRWRFGGSQQVYNGFWKAAVQLTARAR